MIGSDIWDCREKPFERRALLCFEERSYLQGCLATVRILDMRGSFRGSVMRDGYSWVEPVLS